MKRILYTLLGIMLSISAWAQVAKIGTTEYATLTEAVAAVPSDGSATTITMLENVDLTTTIAVVYGQNVVLDLNNHNIISTVLAIKNLGDLEVTGTGNITVNGTKNTLYGISNAGAAGKKANLIIGENVTVTAPCVAILTSYGKTIVNGTLANKQADASNIYSTLYLSQTSSEVIVAESATVTGIVNAIYGAKGTLEVNSTNVGKIYADGSATQGLKIKKTAAIESLNVYGHAEFSDVADYYVAAKAISACTGTVKLLSDINAALAVSAGKTVTLDLNGHKVSAESYPIKVEGNLTITGEGTVQSTGMGSNTSVQAAAYVLKDGKLTIESGNYVAGYEGAEGNPAVYVRDNAVVEIKGGDFVGGSKFLLNKLDASRETSVIKVTGGTFHNNFNPADNTAEGEHTNFVAADYKVIDNGDGTYKVIPYDYVAQVGDVKYESLAEAITAAQNGETVTLLADVTDNITIPAGKNITLDLNGKTLSGGSVASNGKKAAIVNNGTIVIQDSSAEQTGTIKREDDDTGLTASNSYYVIDNQGTMTIKSGTITNKAGLTTAHKGSSLIRNGEVVEGAVLNIEGGTLTQDNFDVIKNGGQNSVLNITGGTINSANSYAILSYDKVNMSAGSVTGKVCLRSYDDDNAVANISGGTINGNITVETYPGNTPTNLSECNISGAAVINGTLSVGEGNGNTFTANDDKGTIAVSGGTFENSVPEQYCAEGFIPVKNAEGTYGVKEGSFVAQIGDVKYESISDAIAAAENGATITLITDVIENITIPADKNITLDLGGYTLNGKQTANSPTIKNLGTLTVKNGNVRREGEGSASWYVVENEGTITMDEGLNVEGSASASLIRNNAATAQMTFNDGTYTQTGAFIVVKNDLGTVVVNGGTFSTADNKNVLNNWDQMTINGGTFTGNIFNGAYDTNNNKLTINDGTFNTSQIRTYLGNGQTTCPIEIKGGTFKNDQMKYVGTGNKESDTDVQVSVSGGTFANPVPEKYCAEGFIPEDNGDGTYGVKEGAYIARIGEQGYETLDAAIEAAKQEESAITITLLADAETTKETLPANVTINANGKVLTMPSFVVLDGEAFTLPNITGADTYKVRTATYIRTNISTTEWGTVCLPFSLTSGNGANYYTYNNINGNTLTVDEVENTETIAPNTPVLFKKAKGGDLEINQTDAIVNLKAYEASLATSSLVGTYTSSSIDADGSIYFINSDTFHKAQVSLTVPAYRAYINYTAPTTEAAPRTLFIVVSGDESTAIGTLETADAAVSAIYDASGRKISAPQKGINIMKLANGKTVKVMIK